MRREKNNLNKIIRKSGVFIPDFFIFIGVIHPIDTIENKEKSCYNQW